jgi:ABC-type branched-subunit amino acid transport system substrate-binding protein
MRLSRRLLVLCGILSLLVGIVSLALALPTQALQAQTLKIGVIGAANSPTAQGIALAIDRITARGPLVGPRNARYSFEIVAEEVLRPEDVTEALAKFKQEKVFAIFGPDDDEFAKNNLASLTAAGVPVFIGATSTDIKPAGSVFRTRANGARQAEALTEVLVTELKANKVALYQGSPDVAPHVTNMVEALQAKGKTPAPPVLQLENGAVADSVKVLMGSQPDTIIAYGKPELLAELYRVLRGSNYTGKFVTPHTDTSDFIQNVATNLRGGIYGVTTWPYSWDTPDSADLTRDYVAAFSDVPTPLSAAAYDAAVALILGSLKEVGPAPDALLRRFMALPKANSIQGTFNPKLGDNELSANVAVIVTERTGGPTLIARFDETGRLPLIDTTPTPTPRPPTATRQPSPTLDGVVGIVRTATATVRTGPGTNYPAIGSLRRNEQVRLIGANNNFTWFVIMFRQQQAWVAASTLRVVGNARELPLVAAPPTPIPSPTLPPTLTPTAAPIADIVLISAAMNPAIPQPGVPFTLNVTIRNQGGANAGEFAVAAAFKPGEVFASSVVPGLPAGQQTSLNLSATVNGTIAEARVAIVMDLNNQVDEGPGGEANNKPEFVYRVDRNKIAQGTATIPSGSNADFQGGNPDVNYDGTKIAPINGATLGLLTGVQMTQIHYDFLSPDKINNGVGIAIADLVPGAVIGIYTAEGKRGALRVVQPAGGTLVLEFFIYDS